MTASGVGAHRMDAVDARLQLAIGWEFRDRALLDLALTHRSYCAERGVASSNERLEFLGDSVLGFVVTRFTYHEYPALPEGELAKLRAAVVSAETLGSVAEEIDLGAAMRLGKGEAASGGRAKQSILADGMEAVIAAVYLDAGMEVAQRVVLGMLESRIRDQATGPGVGDHKTRLQELAARHADQLPRYTVRSEGPDHSRQFFATVSLRGVQYGAGEGRSKKTAEQAAARIAWERLQSETAGASGDVGSEPGTGPGGGATSASSDAHAGVGDA